MIIFSIFHWWRDKIRKCQYRVLHSHSMKGTPRGDVESNSISTNGVGDGLDDFERKPCPILDWSTIFVWPLVWDVLKELIWEISTSKKELNTIKTCLVDGFISCICVPLKISLDFVDRERPRGRVGGRNRDIGGSNQIKIRIFSLERVEISGTTHRPELEEDVWTVGMHCIYNLYHGEGQRGDFGCSRTGERGKNDVVWEGESTDLKRSEESRERHVSVKLVCWDVACRTGGLISYLLIRIFERSLPMTEDDSCIRTMNDQSANSQVTQEVRR